MIKIKFKSTGLMLTLAVLMSSSHADEYRLNLRGSAPSVSPAEVFMMSVDTYLQEFKSSVGKKAPRDKIKRFSRSRTLQVSPDLGGNSVEAGLTTIKDGEYVVICAVGPELRETKTLYLTLWNRSNDENVQNVNDFTKIYPTGSSDAEMVGSDELFCVGQPGSGFRVKGQYDRQGLSEQIYAHFTSIESNQLGSDDVFVAGKSSTSRNLEGDYWSAISVFNVVK